MDIARNTHYRSPKGCFVKALSPAKLKIRGGKEYALKKGEFCYIRPDAPALRWRIAKQISAAVLFITLLIVLSVCFISDRSASHEIAKIMNDGYQSLEDLPQEYLDLVPGIDKKVLFADVGCALDGVGESCLRKLIVRLGEEAIYDLKLVPFYMSILNGNQYGTKVRSSAMRRLAEIAEHHGRADLMIHLHDHDLEFIKDEARRRRIPGE